MPPPNDLPRRFCIPATLLTPTAVNTILAEVRPVKGLSRL